MALPPDFAELNSMVGIVAENQELEEESNEDSRPTGERDGGGTNGSANEEDMIREVAEDGDVPMDHQEADPAWRNQNPAMAAEEEVIHGTLSDKGL